MRQQVGIFAGIIGPAIRTAVSAGSDAEGLGRWD